MLIRKLRIENIRSIKSTEIPLSRLNIFIGENASGKSSILYSLLALRNLKRGIKSAPESFRDMKWLRREGVDSTMLIGIDGEVVERESVRFKYTIRFLPTLSYKSRLSLQNYNLFEVAATARRDEEALEAEEGILNEDWAFFEKLRNRTDPYGGMAVLEPPGSTHLLYDQPKGPLSHPVNPDRQFLMTDSGQAYQRARDHLISYVEDMQYIPVRRGAFSLLSPQYTDRPSGIDEGDEAADQFLNLLIYPDYVTQSTLERIKKWAARFDVEGFEAVIQPGHMIEGRGSTSEGRKKIPLALYGFGSNQFIHVVGKCIFAQDGAPILIEEPEIHLHPKKQAEAADFLIETMKDNHQLLVATHSEHVIGRLQRRIADGTIDSDDVCLLWVKYESEEQGTVVEVAKINENGIIHEGLQSYLRFFQEELKATQKARGRRG